MLQPSSNRIILALDVDTEKQALDLAQDLTGYVGAFKVGMQLFYSAGPKIVSKINDLGGKVFLDLKLHDIPNTTGAAARVLTRMQCLMFNVHAAGGREMMTRVCDDVKDESLKNGITKPIILAVTVLTSISETELERDMLISDLTVAQAVAEWARTAQESGMNGVVCSPQEISVIREGCGQDFVIVTPGIRPVWSSADDQKRITTPRQALDMGADYMVIGRPITGAARPREAALRIVEELEG